MVGAISERGIEPARSEAYPNEVRKTSYRDADGNEVSFAGGPAGD